MITATDLLRLPYTPDLTRGGIAYACRSLAYTYDRMGGLSFERLRRIVAGIAVELAFRRYLGEQGVPFDVLGATPFTEPDRYDISLAGHRCDIKSYHISRRRQIRLLRREPAAVLKAEALIPLDQLAAEGHKPDDIYLFAFLLGLTAASQEDTERAIRADQPVHLIHPLPDPWARPTAWAPLEKLALKSECSTPIPVEIGGQDAERNFVTMTLELPPKQRVNVKQPFYSLAYLHVPYRPEARIGIHSPRYGDAYIIPPHEWGNIWIYGMEIWFAGWLTHEAFRRKAAALNAGSRAFQYDHTRVKNLFVPVAELNPIQPLLEQIKTWEAERRERLDP